MNPGTPTRYSHSGFTLLELLLATAIFSIVLVAINVVLFAALTLRQHAITALDETRPLEQGLATLRRDLENALPPGAVLSGPFTCGVTGGGQSVSGLKTINLGLNVTSSSQTGMEQLDGLSFSTATGILREDVPWADVQAVNYRLADPLDRDKSMGKDLVRTVQRNLLSFSATAPETQVLAGNIEKLEFSFFDGMQWRDLWEATAASPTLPRAVKLAVYPAVDPKRSSAPQSPVELIVRLSLGGAAASSQAQGTEGAQ